VSRPSGEFYVLYLPVPPGLRRVALLVAAGLLITLPVLAGTLAWTQPDPGPAIWSDDRVESLSGVLAAAPYAALFPDDGSPPVLVVESGKHGGRPRADAFHAHRVTLRGTMLRREGHAMIELVDGPDAITSLAADQPLPPIEPLRHASLRGEIVDAKCWHGAMKPGAGRTHKACAALCIRGGIPPVLVVRADERPPSIALLTGVDGGPIDDHALQFLAEPVDVEGELADWRGLTVLRLRPINIQPR
jgi:hypothetical protein